MHLRRGRLQSHICTTLLSTIMARGKKKKVNFFSGQLVAAFPNQYEQQSKVFSSVLSPTQKLTGMGVCKDLALSKGTSKQVRLSAEVSLTCLDNPLDAFLLNTPHSRSQNTTVRFKACATAAFWHQGEWNEPRNRLRREAVQAPSLEGLRTPLDKALKS